MTEKLCGPLTQR